MSPYPHSQKRTLPALKTLIFIGFFVLLFLFAFSRAYNMLYGPRIVIDSPRDGVLLDANVLTVRGTIKNAALIHLNGRKIFTDAKGSFNEDVVLQDGLNIFSLSARDRFGREKEELLHIVHHNNEAAELSLVSNNVTE
jgi:hypothetical protein